MDKEYTIEEITYEKWWKGKIISFKLGETILVFDQPDGTKKKIKQILNQQEYNKILDAQKKILEDEIEQSYNIEISYFNEKLDKSSDPQRLIKTELETVKKFTI